MNANSNNDEPATRMALAKQTGVKTSTFLGAVALSVALLGVAAGWLGHKPPVLGPGEVQATNINVAPHIAGKVEAWQGHQEDKVTKGQLLASIENQQVQTRLGQDCPATSSTKGPKRLLRDSCAEHICVQSNCWVKAKAAAEQAQQTFDSSRELQAAGVMSLEELRSRERDLDLARNSEQAARANFDLAVALSGEIDRLAAAAEHADQAIAELQALVGDAARGTAQ